MAFQGCDSDSTHRIDRVARPDRYRPVVRAKRAVKSAPLPEQSWEGSTQSSPGQIPAQPGAWHGTAFDDSGWFHVLARTTPPDSETARRHKVAGLKAPASPGTAGNVRPTIRFSCSLREGATEAAGPGPYAGAMGRPRGASRLGTAGAGDGPDPPGTDARGLMKGRGLTQGRCLGKGRCARPAPRSPSGRPSRPRPRSGPA